jgi:polyribonucleotide nucleotidyltransferase
LDTKLEGIPDEILAKALNQAKVARFKILDVIEEAIPAPRATVGDSAPTVTTIQINPEKIGAVIGPGGAVIKKITGETGASIDIQQDGRVLVGGSSGSAVQDAIARIKALTDEVALGSEFTGKVTRIMGRGAMVEYIPGREGLVPKEHLSPKMLGRIEDAVNIGDELNVKVFEIDHMGRVNLTAMGVAQSLPSLSENESATPPPPGERGGGGRNDRGGGRDRGGDRGGRDRDRGGRDRGGDRGGDRRPPRSFGDSEPAAPRQSESEAADVSAPQVPDSFPKREQDENVNARFRPRR